MTTTMYKIYPLEPYMDGYHPYDEMIVPLVITEQIEYGSNGLTFTKSNKTCYVSCDWYMDTFRKKGNYWICLGSKSKQKWMIEKV